MHNLIKQIKLGESERQNTIQKATSWMNKFISDGETTIGKAFVLPRFITNINSILSDAEYRFGIEANDLSELFNLSEFEQLFFEKIKIKRIYSWLGYFWWEFYKDVSTNVNLRFCKNWVNIIVGGRSDRVNCSKEENTKCFNERQAKRQRKSYYRNH